MVKYDVRRIPFRIPDCHQVDADLSEHLFGDLITPHTESHDLRVPAVSKTFKLYRGDASNG